MEKKISKYILLCSTDSHTGLERREGEGGIYIFGGALSSQK